MAQVIAIQATVAQMNFSKRRNIGVPFPLRHARSLGQKSEPRLQNQFSVPAKCELFESGDEPGAQRPARLGIRQLPSPPLAGRG